MSKHLAKKKKFYDNHVNFSKRQLLDYNLSPGTKAKYDIMIERIGKRVFHKALDVGCSGNSILPFINNINHRNFLDLAHEPLTYYSKYSCFHPSVGSITNMPYKTAAFDLVTALDVIEHIKDDKLAAKEINRVIQQDGILIISVPHKMKYYSQQDIMIGHYRRYELSEIIKLFKPFGFHELCSFGIYGQIMRFAQFSQKSNPEKLEKNLSILREKYQSNPAFKKIWDKMVQIGSACMKMDAIFQPKDKIMNICTIFKKRKK